MNAKTTWHRLLSMLLCIIIVAGMLPTVGFAASAPNLPAGHSHDTWTPYGLEDVTSFYTNDGVFNGGSGSYYLTQDIDGMYVTVTVNAGETLNICLNGHRISNRASMNNANHAFGDRTCFFTVEGGGTLNICDCSQDQSGSIVMYCPDTDGTQRGAGVVELSAKYDSGDISNTYVNPVFNLYSGTLSAVKSETNQYGLNGVGIIGNNQSEYKPENRSGLILLGVRQGAAQNALKLEFNMYGGTLNYEDAIMYGSQTDVNIHGGAVINGDMMSKGGVLNLLGTSDSEVVVNGLADAAHSVKYATVETLSFAGDCVIENSEINKIGNTAPKTLTVTNSTIQTGSSLTNYQDGASYTVTDSSMGGTVLNLTQGSVTLNNASGVSIENTKTVEIGGNSVVSSVSAGTLTVKGSATLNGETNFNDTVTLTGTPTVSQLNLKENQKITIGTQGLSAGASITVSCAIPQGILENPASGTDLSEYFHAVSGGAITRDAATGQLNYTMSVEHNGEHYVAFDPTMSTLTTGKYYLTSSIERTSPLTINEGEDVTLCLHGHDISGSGETVIINLGTLTLCNESEGRNTIKYTGSNAESIAVFNYGTMTIDAASKILIDGGSGIAIDNRGIFTWESTVGRATSAGVYTLKNAPSATMTIKYPGIENTGSGKTLIFNAGNASITSNGDIGYTNGTLVENVGGELSISAYNFEGNRESGTAYKVSGGKLTINGHFSIYGNAEVGSAGELVLNEKPLGVGNVTVAAGGKLTANAGVSDTVTNNGGTVVLNGYFTKRIINNGGTLTATGVRIGEQNAEDCVSINGGSVILNNCKPEYRSSNYITLNSGSLVLNGAVGTLDGGKYIVKTGTETVDLTLNGEIDLGSSARIILQGSNTIKLGDEFYNTNRINLQRNSAGTIVTNVNSADFANCFFPAGSYTISYNSASQTLDFAEAPNHLHDGQEYTALTRNDSELTTGYYYLKQDTALATYWLTIPENQNVTLCLNGKTLSQCRIVVESGAELTVCDCSGTNAGGIEKMYGLERAINVAAGATLNFSGGTLKVVNGDKYAVENAGGTINVSGGIFDVNNVTNTSLGSSSFDFFGGYGTFNISGGAFTTCEYIFPVRAEAAVEGKTSTINITGGNFNASKNHLQPTAVFLVENGVTLNLINANFDNIESYGNVVVVRSGGIANIQGGSFASDPTLAFSQDSPLKNEGGTINITGGNFDIDANKKFLDSAGGTTTLSGGTFANAGFILLSGSGGKLVLQNGFTLPQLGEDGTNCVMIPTGATIEFGDGFNMPSSALKILLDCKQTLAKLSDQEFTDDMKAYFKAKDEATYGIYVEESQTNIRKHNIAHAHGAGDTYERVIIGADFSNGGDVNIPAMNAYLDGDIAAENALKIYYYTSSGAHRKLCLNGHDITAQSPILLYNSFNKYPNANYIEQTFTLCNCNEKQSTITGGLSVEYGRRTALNLSNVKVTSDSDITVDMGNRAQNKLTLDNVTLENTKEGGSVIKPSSGDTSEVVIKNSSLSATPTGSVLSGAVKLTLEGKVTIEEGRGIVYGAYTTINMSNLSTDSQIYIWNGREDSAASIIDTEIAQNVTPEQAACVKTVQPGWYIRYDESTQKLYLSPVCVRFDSRLTSDRWHEFSDRNSTIDKTIDVRAGEDGFFNVPDYYPGRDTTKKIDGTEGFLGWFTTPYGEGEEVVFPLENTLAAPLTVYARWKVINTPITVKTRIEEYAYGTTYANNSNDLIVDITKGEGRADSEKYILDADGQPIAHFDGLRIPADILRGLDAGEYTLRVYLRYYVIYAPDNTDIYGDTVTAETTFRIVKQGSNIELTATDGYYTGNPRVASFNLPSANLSECLESYRITYVGIDGTDYPETETAPTNVGKYRAKLADYTPKDPKDGGRPFTITKDTVDFVITKRTISKPNLYGSKETFTGKTISWYTENSAPPRGCIYTELTPDDERIYPGTYQFNLTVDGTNAEWENTTETTLTYTYEIVAADFSSQKPKVKVTAINGNTVTLGIDYPTRARFLTDDVKSAITEYCITPTPDQPSAADPGWSVASEHTLQSGTQYYIWCRMADYYHENNENVNVRCVIGSQISESIPLKLAQDVVLTLDANKGHFTGENNEILTQITRQAKVGVVFDLSTVSAPTRMGYTFKGWARANNASTAEYTDSVSPVATATLYAVWEAVPHPFELIVTPEVVNDGEDFTISIVGDNTINATVSEYSRIGENGATIEHVSGLSTPVDEWSLTKDKATLGKYRYRVRYNYELEGDSVETKRLEIAVVVGKSARSFADSSVTVADCEYNGSEYAGYTGTPHFTNYSGDIDITYYLADGITKTTSANSGASAEGGLPVNAGNYKVVFAIPYSDITCAGYAEKSFTITPKPVDVTFIEGNNLEYGNANMTYPTATVSAADLIVGDVCEVTEYSYSLNAGAATTTPPTGVGSYTMTVTALSNPNYVLRENSYSFSITAKTVDNLTVELSESEFTYDCTEKRPTVTVKDGETVIDESEYTVAYSDNIDAGTAKVTITDNDGGNYTVNGYAEFTIKSKPVTPTVILSTNTFTYDSTEKKPDVTVKDGAIVIDESEYTVAYSDNIDAGTAKVTITDNDGGNYTVNGYAEFTINSKPVTPTVILSTNTFTYDGTEKKPAVTVKDGETVIDESEYTVAYIRNTNAGEAKVTVTDNAGGNYNIEKHTESFTIDKAELKIDHLSFDLSSQTYDGNEKTVAVNLNDAYTGVGDIAVYYDGATDNPTASGDYTVSIKTSNGTNFIDCELELGTFHIAKAPVEKPVADNTRFVYSGSEQTYTIAASELYTVTGNKQTNADTYEVQVALNDKANYEWADGTTADLKFDFTIAKAPVEKPGADTNEFVYSGSEQTYTIAASELYTVTGNKQTNADTYEIQVALNDKANYEWADGTTDDLKFTFHIAKAPVVKPGADNTQFVYSGSEQTYTIAASELYTVTGNKQTNADTYEVEVALNDKANYEWADGTTDDLKFTFHIAKAPVVKPGADTNEFVYSGMEQTYTIAASELYTVTGNKQTNADTYEVQVALNDKANYEWADGTTDDLKFTFHIAKADSTITITPDRTMLRGGGKVVLTVVSTPASEDNTVTCDVDSITTTITKNADGTFTANLPNGTNTYTFTAAFAENANYNASTATCVVEGRRYVAPVGNGADIPVVYDVYAADASNGTVSVNPGRASAGEKVTITVKADEGYALDTIVASGKDGKSINLTENNGKYTFEMPVSNVTVKASFKKIAVVNPFVDVKTDNYFHDAVLWAVDKGITVGTSKTTFSPNEPCTRAQIVTFLWRAVGSPEAKNAASFSDVAADAYYAEAIAWAVENGVTVGTGKGKFSPDEICTRAQAVTFLCRVLKGKATADSTFSDVAADSYYAEAVAWAAANDIIYGTSATKFSPEDVCTRGQIVTLLFRAMAE